MRGIGTLFAGLVVLLTVTALTVYMVHAYLVAQQSLREQQLLYEKARYIAEHANITGSTISLPEPADLIVVDPSGVPHVAKDVKTLTLPWSPANLKIYVAKRGQTQIAAADPVASAAALASVAAAPLQPLGNTSSIAGCEWYLDPFIYNITGSATAYRGYILYKEMPQVGYFFYISSKYLCQNPPPGSNAFAYPMGILGFLGVNTTRLLSNCPGVYVTDIAIVPYIGALLLTDNGMFYLIYYNGTWQELGGTWSLSSDIDGVHVEATRICYTSLCSEWKLHVNISEPVINVNYTRTKRFLARYDELWVSSSMNKGMIIAARSWTATYFYYDPNALREFPPPPGVFVSVGAYVKGPNYTLGLQGAAITNPMDAYIYKRC